MLLTQKQRLQTAVGLIDNIMVNPDVDIEYFIPGVVVTTNGGAREVGGPYIQFSYASASDSLDPHIQRMHLTRDYLEKEPEDLANFATYSLERFMEEIDSRQYGAQ